MMSWKPRTCAYLQVLSFHDSPWIAHTALGKIIFAMHP
jgi:hypothetical protein